MTSKLDSEDIEGMIAQFQTQIYDAQSILVSQLKATLAQKEIIGNPKDFARILSSFNTEQNMDMGTLALLSGLSANTLTRLRKDLSSSRIDTVNAVLDVMGLELVIARKGKDNE
jgi:DNA-binding phage protein